MTHNSGVERKNDSVPKMIRPSEFEFKLLRHLWRHKRLSAREIHEASVVETQWSHSTTRKTLDRMVEKGLVRLEVVHGVNTYAATQSKLETIAVLAQAFAREVLDLSAPVPAATFASSRLVTPEEMDELDEILQRLSKSGTGETQP